ncbi:PPE family protein [Mycobacterium canetti]|uniref:PPE family protein n=1 Tax=Mycobacterium canetti TaxID=78331 RepID=UPI001E2F47A5|nr:PPE family protein [Mycobacterium canetti]
MDFTIFPPEFNSLNIQGSARPFLVAANAWKNLSNELSYAASRFESEINGLIAEWRGPASALMAAAVAPFQAWMVATASLAELVADHIGMVAGAYEAAHAAHVPLPVIETNRLTRLALALTNFLGIHTPAIFALDALYAQYWAQDGGAMNLYAAIAAAAARLTPFSPPAPIANPGALARLYELISSVSETLRAFAAPATSNLPSKVWTLLTKSSYPLMAARISSIPVEYMLAFVEGSNMGQIMGQLAVRSLAPAVKGPLELLPNAVRPAVSATLGNADTIGGLSVPPSWVADKSITPLAKAVPTSAPGGPSGTSWAQLGLASLAGGAVGAVAARTRPGVIPRSPATG